MRIRVPCTLYSFSCIFSFPSFCESLILEFHFLPACLPPSLSLKKKKTIRLLAIIHEAVPMAPSILSTQYNHHQAIGPTALHCPKGNPNFRDITRNAGENEILHEIFRLVSSFRCYIPCYISENKLPLGQCRAYTTPSLLEKCTTEASSKH